MERISIHEICLDSVLAEPLLDSEGRILLSQGVRLTPTLIRRLERWCVAQVTVASLPSQHATEVDDTSDLPGCWDHQFANHDDDPEMATIHRALVQWESTRRSSPQT